MARPYKYKLLDTVRTPDGRDVNVLGEQTMYGVKRDDYWVAIGKKFMDQSYTKYQQLFTTSRKVAQNHCDRLNDVFDTDIYRVVEIYTDD